MLPFHDILYNLQAIFPYFICVFVHNKNGQTLLVSRFFVPDKKSQKSFTSFDEIFLGTGDEYQTLNVEKKIFLTAFFLREQAKFFFKDANIYK